MPSCWDEDDFVALAVPKQKKPAPLFPPARAQQGHTASPGEAVFQWQYWWAELWRSTYWSPSGASAWVLIPPNVQLNHARHSYTLSYFCDRKRLKRRYLEELWDCEMGVGEENGWPALMGSPAGTTTSFHSRIAIQVQDGGPPFPPSFTAKNLSRAGCLEATCELWSKGSSEETG